MYSKQLTLILLLLAFCVYLSTSRRLSNMFPYGKLEIITIGNGKTLKVGILSASQLNASKKDSDLTYTEYLENSLNLLKKQNIEVLIFAGDISDKGTRFAFRTFRKLINRVFSDTKPILDIIMGNHDYWYGLNIPFIQQSLFYDEIGEMPMGHKVIKGYHFINWGNTDNFMYKTEPRRD